MTTLRSSSNPCHARLRRRIAATGVLLLLGLVTPATVEAAWSPARVLAREADSRAAGASGDGALLLWAGTRAIGTRFAWAPGAAAPTSVRFRLPFRPDRDAAWHVNERGEVLAVDDDLTPRVRAVLVSADGGQAVVDHRVPDGTEAGAITAALGDDGTAVVAWLLQNEMSAATRAQIWLRIRRGGGDFSPPIVLRTRGAVSQVDVDVRRDGVAELLYAEANEVGHALHHVDIPPETNAPSSASMVGETSSAAPFPMKLIAGGSGVGRVFFTPKDANPPASGRAVVATRTGDTSWSLPQVFERHTATAWPAVTSLPDGSSLIAYDRQRNVMVRKAEAGEPFGLPQRAGRAPRGWYPGWVSIGANADGVVVAAWQEELVAGDCGEPCFGRIVAATASESGEFHSSRVLSPIGNVLSDWYPGTVSAVDPNGRRLVAWRSSETSLYSPNSLLASIGDSRPDRLQGDADTTAPGVRVSASRRGVRAALRTGRLRVRLRCSETCAIRVSLFDSAWEDGVRPLRAVRVCRGRTTTRSWRLSNRDRRVIKRALKRGSPRLTAVATDAAGNAASSRVHPRRLSR